MNYDLKKIQEELRFFFHRAPKVITTITRQLSQGQVPHGH